MTRVELEKILSGFMGSFPRVSAEQVKFYANAIYSKGFDKKIVVDVLMVAAEKYDKLPLLKDLLRELRIENGDEKQALTKVESDEAFHKKLAEERKLETQIRERFTKLVTAEKLKEYYAFWMKEVYGKDFADNIKALGFDHSIFQRPALFDLEAAKGDCKKAIEIGRSKNVNSRK